MLALWYPSTLVIIFTVHLAMSRHIEHSDARTTSHENLREDESSWMFPKAHLRLHSKPPKVLHTKEGSSEILECQAGGSPLPRIYWLKNGVQLSKIDLADELELKTPDDEGNNPKLNIGSTSSRLYLDCLSIGDEAEYSCIAESANHRESSMTRLTISSSDERRCQDKKHHGQAPRILSWTKTVLENQGEDVNVICRVQGDPQPVIKWQDPREEDIEDSEKYDISSNGDLVIRNLKWKDMGNYICMAENIHGTARVEIFVYPATPET